MIKSKEFWISVVLTIAVAVVVGCGGGGGAGGSGGGVEGFLPKPGQYIEFTFVQSGDIVDPMNLVVGDQVKMVLANYDLFGTRTVLTTGAWSLSNGASSFSLDSFAGQFTVLASPGTFFKFRTTSFVNGANTLFEQDGNVPTVIPTVVGKVVELGAFSGIPTATGIPYLQVDFFNASGTRVGGSRTDRYGRFSARVPTTATHMMILGSTIKTSHFYKSVYYEGLYFAPLIDTCRVPVGALGNGVNTLTSPLALPVVSGVPPPPPNGCP